MKRFAGTRGLVPKIQTGLNSWDWSLRLEFEAKMASSHGGTCPRNLLQGLVAGTSPLVSADLKERTINHKGTRMVKDGED